MNGSDANDPKETMVGSVDKRTSGLEHLDWNISTGLLLISTGERMGMRCDSA